MLLGKTDEKKNLLSAVFDCKFRCKDDVSNLTVNRNYLNLSGNFERNHKRIILIIEFGYKKTVEKFT